jgi:hypothetical protein
MVYSAGNDGTTGNPRVRSPAAAFNNISAAALASDTSSPPYNTRASFSNFGPNDFWNPATQTFVPGVLSVIDLAAPGTNFNLAFYGGTTGGNTGGTSTPGNDLYRLPLDGTSWAAPTIAGGAGLLVDVGKATLPLLWRGPKVGI